MHVIDVDVNPEPAWADYSAPTHASLSIHLGHVGGKAELRLKPGEPAPNGPHAICFTPAGIHARGDTGRRHQTRFRPAAGVRNARSTVEDAGAAALISQRSTPAIGAVFGGRVPEPRSVQSALFRRAHGGGLHRLPAVGRRTSAAPHRGARALASPARDGLPHGALVRGGAPRRSGRFDGSLAVALCARVQSGDGGVAASVAIERAHLKGGRASPSKATCVACSRT